MITLKSPCEIEAMGKLGQILDNIHVGLRDLIKPGITTMEIKDFVEKEIRHLIRTL